MLKIYILADVLVLWIQIIIRSFYNLLPFFALLYLCIIKIPFPLFFVFILITIYLSFFICSTTDSSLTILHLNMLSDSILHGKLDPTASFLNLLAKHFFDLVLLVRLHLIICCR